ncbi:hypothetical protein [Cryobacterium lyxosi]|uniref:Uncharacterized protein n=1 Tax=Cryobacterium lyxosi TaxID=1259228 RepID=A0A4R8ZFU7_9MICO|nr:hypothetical protein [Cryobacterium lyxosi]TFD26630.1 hypothetical protein E3T27_07615 [Cryobacterium lyxosi]
MESPTALVVSASQPLNERLQVKLADDCGWLPMGGFGEMVSVLAGLGRTPELEFALFRRSDRPSLWAQVVGGSGRGYIVEVFQPGTESAFGESGFVAGVRLNILGHTTVTSSMGRDYCGRPGQVMHGDDAAAAIRAWLTQAAAAPGQDLSPIERGGLPCSHPPRIDRA